MKFWRGFRSVATIALSLVLFAGLPGFALADSSVKPATQPHITGVVRNSVGVLAGIDVYAIGTSYNSTHVLTDANGLYSLAVASDTYQVNFDDLNFVYLYGAYNTGSTGNLEFGDNGATDVAVDAGTVALQDVTLTAGTHIKGKVTGPATPANQLQGINVFADSLSISYYAHAQTTADGTYTVTVPGGNYRVEFSSWQGFYVNGCYLAGFSTDFEDCSVNVDSPNDTTGVNVTMPLAEGVTLTLSPATGTVPARSTQTYTATLTGGEAPHFMPAGKFGSEVDISDVTSVTTFTISGGGSCVGAVCTPPVEGDYSVSGAYSVATGGADLQATAPLATPTPTAPPAAPAVTPAPTSTTGSGSSPDGTFLVLVLAALIAASFTKLALGRRVRI
jgi:hypothetical protein